MPNVRVANYNVENLFARPRAFDPTDPAAGEPVLAAHAEFNALIAKSVYSNADRDRVRDLLVALDIYFVKGQGAVRRKDTRTPR